MTNLKKIVLYILLGLTSLILMDMIFTHSSMFIDKYNELSTSMFGEQSNSFTPNVLKPFGLLLILITICYLFYYFKRRTKIDNLILFILFIVFGGIVGFFIGIPTIFFGNVDSAIGDYVKLLGAIIGGLFLIWGLIINNERVHQQTEQNRISERGQIGIRFKDGVHSLSEDSISANMAGIYALHQIAKELVNQKDQLGYIETIHDVLYLYIDEHCSIKEGEPRKEKKIIQSIIDRLVKKEGGMIYSKYKIALPYVDLSSLDLSRANLSIANLSGANLSGANLLKANLSEANLEEANLFIANLSEANLLKANLSRTNLFIANLSGANLLKANLSGANLSGANLLGANLISANLSEANLLKANLEGVYLFRANLREANLSKANLREANLEGANLEGANLLGANLEEANLEEANLTIANLERAHLEGANLEGAHLEGAHLSEAHLVKANLEGAGLWRADLTIANLSEANLKGAHLVKANLEGANLWGANLSEANIEGVNFSEANLEGAKFYIRRLIDISIIHFWMRVIAIYEYPKDKEYTESELGLHFVFNRDKLKHSYLIAKVFSGAIIEIEGEEYQMPTLEE